MFPRPKLQGDGRLESFQNSPLKCISLQDQNPNQAEIDKPRFATPEFTSTPLMKMTSKQPFSTKSESDGDAISSSILPETDILSPFLKPSDGDFLLPTVLHPKQEPVTSTTSPLLNFANSVLSPAPFPQEGLFTFSLTGESSNDSETTESEYTCESIDFSDMTFESERAETPPGPGILFGQRKVTTPSLLFSPSPVQKMPILHNIHKTPEKITPNIKTEAMNVDFVFGTPTEEPVPTPPVYKKMNKSLAPVMRTPIKPTNLVPQRIPTNLIPPRKKPGECLSPNTLFHKPMETLVGEIQKLMCNSSGPAPPAPNINKSRKRGRVNTRVSFLLGAGQAKQKQKEKQKKKTEQSARETRKQRRVSEVATPPQYETQKRRALPCQQTRQAPKTRPLHHHLHERQLKRKPKAHNKREVTPEPPKPQETQELEKRCIAAQVKSRKRKRTPTVRKYNFRFKRRKPNTPTSMEEKVDTIQHVRTPLQFTCKLHVDVNRWNDVVGGVLGDVLGNANPTLIDIPSKKKFRSFTDGMFGDQVHTQKLTRKEPNVFILSEETSEVTSDEQRFIHCIRMIRNDNDSRLIEQKLNNKSAIQRIQQAFGDLAKFCNQNGRAPVKHRTFSNFDSPDRSTVDVGKVADGIHVIFGDNKLSGVNTKKRYFSMVGSVTPLHEECLQLGSLHYNRGPCPLYFCVIPKTKENDIKLQNLRSRVDINFNPNKTGHGFVHPRLLEDEGITFEHGFLPSGHMLILPCGSIYQTLTIGFTVWESIAVCGDHWFELFVEHAANLSLYTAEIQNFAYPPNFNIFTQPGRQQIADFWKTKLKLWKSRKSQTSITDENSFLAGDVLETFWCNYEATEAFQRRIRIFPFPRNFVTRFHIFRFQTHRPLKVSANITLTNGFCTLWDNQEEWKSLSMTTNFDDHMIAFCVWVIRNKAVAKLANNKVDFQTRLNGLTLENEDLSEKQTPPQDIIKDEDVYPWAVQLYPHEIINLEAFNI